MKKNLLKFLPEIFLAVVILLILLPILKPGFFSIHDETHIVDVYEMFRSLSLGGFPPRFAPDFNFGLGHPYFNFYYHLPFYITTLFHFLGFSLTDSFKYMMGIAVIFAGVGFYFFSKNHFSSSASALGAAIYILSPYFAVDLYVRGGLGELAVFGSLPWCGYFIFKFVNNPGILKFVYLSISIYLLAISHNVLHIFTFPLLFGYGLTLILMNKEKVFKKILILTLGFLSGISLAGYYLFPALLEKQFISEYEQINLLDHFPFIKQLIIPNFGYGISHWGPGDDLSFNIGVFNLLSVLLIIILFKFLPKQNKILATFFLLVFIICIVLMNSRSYPFWNLNKTLRLFQFPWRMLLFTTFSTAFLAGLVFDYLPEKLKGLRKEYLFVFLFFAVVLTNIWYFKPSEHKTISDEKYLQLYFANRTTEGDGERKNLSPEYLNFAEDFIPPTKWQTKRLNDLPLNWVEASSAAKISYEKRDGFGYKVNIDTETDNDLVIYTTYFPGWSAKIDKNSAPVFPFSEYGIMRVPVEKGVHEIVVEFKNTTVRSLSNLLSVVTLIALILAFTAKKFKL